MGAIWVRREYGRLRLRARDPGYRKTPGLLKRRRTSSTGCLRATTSDLPEPVGWDSGDANRDKQRRVLRRR